MGPKTHLDIEWSKGRGREISAPPDFIPLLSFAEAEAELDASAEHGIPAICWRGDAPVPIRRFQLRENTEYLVDITLPPNVGFPATG